MPHVPSPDVVPLVIRARTGLGLTQQELADLLGISRRTVSRWDAAERLPSNPELHKIARAIFPVDAQLAAAIAAEGGTTVEALGLARRADPPAPAPTPVPAPASERPAPPAPPPRPFPPVALMVDSIVLSAVEAAESQAASLPERDAIRGVLRAAFARARGLGLTLDEVHGALSQPPEGTPAKPAKK
jgi:transcriptional regulator with XRE-family HTH domain